MVKMIKALYVLMIAVVVFLGGLLISKGVSQMEYQAQNRQIQSMEGSAL